MEADRAVNQVKSKEQKVMEEMSKLAEKNGGAMMVIDMKRMAYGGFEA